MGSEAKKIRQDVPQTVLDEINRIDWSSLVLRDPRKVKEVKEKLAWAIKFLALPTR